MAAGPRRVPLYAPRPGWGEGVTFAARRGREVAHLARGTKYNGGVSRLFWPVRLWSGPSGRGNSAFRWPLQLRLGDRRHAHMSSSDAEFQRKRPAGRAATAKIADLLPSGGPLVDPRCYWRFALGPTQTDDLVNNVEDPPTASRTHSFPTRSRTGALRLTSRRFSLEPKTGAGR